MVMPMFAKIYDGKWDRNALDYLALVDQWHVVIESKEVPEGKPVPITLLGEKIVLWRSEGGQVNAWKDYCAHRGAPLSLGKVQNCKIVCPYHGWHFNDAGKCVHVPAHPDQETPAKSVVQQYRAVEKYGFVWVSIGTPQSDVPRIPRWDDDEYRKVHAGPYFYNANALRCLDNFMDASHFPHVHPGINGRGDEPDTTIHYKVIEKEDELQTTEFTVVQPYADARGIPLSVRYHYYCLSPTVAYSDKQTGPNDHWFTWCALTPVDEDRAIFWLVVSFNYGKDIDEKKIHERQAIVFGEQDRWIVEAQRPFSMPLDISEEMHVTSDRLGVAYRRWVKALGEKKRAEISGGQAVATAA
ncbi:Rieske 2Fe-2S domain-containing protein [Noviherbaspirillum sp. ST9]|uniref:aromatic ring-hydroxylating dioxygenase subunit alpha n=1 Tax=Noviherbaspirillum sp. ST9 TaxID=3401606 RepID=UPI003B58726F